MAEGGATHVRVDVADLEALLGPPTVEHDVALSSSLAGVATGLAWTPAGGDILFIEATRVAGSGRLILTGQLGDVMKESAQAALTKGSSRATLRARPAASAASTTAVTSLQAPGASSATPREMSKPTPPADTTPPASKAATRRPMKVAPLISTAGRWRGTETGSPQALARKCWPSITTWKRLNSMRRTAISQISAFSQATSSDSSSARCSKWARLAPGH